MRGLAPETRLFGLALLLAGGTVCADTLQTIEVEAEAQENLAEPRTGEVVESESTSASSRIDATELRRPGASLSQLIGHEVGASVRESGGLGSFSEVTLRGASSEQVLVFLDGLLLNEAAGGGVNLGDIELAQAARVDIYRGSTPVQFGQASLGGAVNIRTPRPGDGPGGGDRSRISLGAGSFAARKLSAMHTAGRDVWDWLATASHLSTDNDFPFTNDNGTHFNADDDREERRHNAQVESNSALFKLGRKLGGGRRSGALLQLFDKSQGIPNWNNAETVQTSLDTRRWQLRGQYSAEGLGGNGRWNGSSGLYAGEKREIYDDRLSQIGLAAQHSEGETRLYGAETYWERIADTHTLSLKADLRRERHVERDLRGIDATERNRRDALSLALQDSRFLLDERLLLTPALRYRYRVDRFDGQRRSSDDIGPQLGARYAFSEQLSLRANAGRYLRAPSFFELFGDRGLFIGNPELRSERASNLDAGLIWHSAERAVEFELGGFYNRVEDLIARVYNARGVGRSVNIADARILGAEARLRARLDARWSLRANLTLQDPLNQSQITAFADKRLPGRASQSGYLRLDYRRGKLGLFYELEAEAGRYYDSANLLPAEDRALHNLGARYRLGEFLLSAEVRNLGDQQHEDFNGFPKPGRSYFASLSWPAAPPPSAE